MAEYRNLWIALLIMALLTPLGLYLPQMMRAGGAWGEWGIDEVRQMIGYVPAGMERMAELWKAPLPDYALPGQENAPLARLSLSYVLSAFIGIVTCAGGAYLLARLLKRREG
jgi:cobalt/nickel transport protein